MRPLKLDTHAEYFFSRARNRGSYCTAYEGQISASHGIAHGHAVPPSEILTIDTLIQYGRLVAWCAGFVLGFYGSYERHEVPGADLDLFDAALLFAHTHKFGTGRGVDEAMEVSIGKESGMDYQLAVGMLNQEMERANANKD